MSRDVGGLVKFATLFVHAAMLLCCVHSSNGTLLQDPFSAVLDGHPPRLPQEPRIPSPCTVLEAKKRTINFTVTEEDELQLDTRRIQDAMDNCETGKSVRLAPKAGMDAFVTGPLITRSGVTLWIDKDVTLYASRNPRDYDQERGKPTCGTDEYDNSGGCQPIISVINVHDVGIVGEGIIDGRGGEPLVGVENTWWDVAQIAKKNKNSHSNPRMIEVKRASNFILYKVSLFNSPKFHAMVNANGFIVWGIKLLTPSHAVNSKGRPLDQHYARNTDGIDPAAASNGYIVHNLISTGDDHIAIKAGGGPTRNLVIAHNHFGSGHGMSIGSETDGDVNRIVVYDLSIDASVQGPPTSDHSGLRIKSDTSRGGIVSDIIYSNVCMRGLPNPILINPHYDKDAEGNAIPTYKNIRFQNIWSEPIPGMKRPPRLTFLGYGSEQISEVYLDNVFISGVSSNDVRTTFARITIGPGPVNIDFSRTGEIVDVIGEKKTEASWNPKCQEKFIQFPYQTEFNDIHIKEDHLI